MMNEKKQKIITRVGMWLAVFVGSIYGLLFTIIGKAINWGPGSGMTGPYWKSLFVGIVSILIAAYIGELIVRKGASMVFKKNRKTLFELSSLMFLVSLVGCIAAFIVSFEVGYLMGKITGTLPQMDWGEILVPVAIMSFLYSLPISFIASILYSVFVSIYLKAEYK